MKKKISCLLLVIGLLVMTAVTVALVKFINRRTSTSTGQTATKTAGLSVQTVLKAHIGSGNTNWTRYAEKATLRYAGSHSSAEQEHFERKLSLATDGTVTRYERTTLSLTQSYLLNGNVLVRTIFYGRTQVETTILDGPEAAEIKSQIATFGPLPILKRLSDSPARVSHVGNSSSGDEFEVEALKGPWRFYTNSQHLIDRLQIDDISITFGDYRQVEGLNLPFYQKVSKGKVFLYEIQFDEINFDPIFAAGTFKS